eukprot:9482148-Pyramimonas_sp.AAC.1
MAARGAYNAVGARAYACALVTSLSQTTQVIPMCRATSLSTSSGRALARSTTPGCRRLTYSTSLSSTPSRLAPCPKVRLYFKSVPSRTPIIHYSYAVGDPRAPDSRPLFEAEEEGNTETSWCSKRYEEDTVGRKTSAGSIWAFHTCGYSFPPLEMVGPESLPQVHNLTQPSPPGGHANVLIKHSRPSHDFVYLPRLRAHVRASVGDKHLDKTS